MKKSQEIVSKLCQEFDEIIQWYVSVSSNLGLWTFITMDAQNPLLQLKTLVVNVHSPVSKNHFGESY